MLDQLSRRLNVEQEAHRLRNEAAFDKWYSRLANADAETLEGYILFGGGPTITIEPEPELNDFDFTERKKFYEDPETGSQLAHLEKFGYYYKNENNMKTEKSELNENLKDAISSNIDTDYDDIYGGPRNFYNGAANEAEIICIEEQIKLLDKLKQELLIRGNVSRGAFIVLENNINQLQNQIETITSLI